MFDIEKFYAECATGEKVDCSELIAYVKSFQNVILRGAAATGRAVGKRLQELGVTVTRYWDVRAEELGTINGVAVEQPFETDFDRNKTVIIYCIPNHVTMMQLVKEIRQQGYQNVLRGDILYTALVCPYHCGDKLTAKICWQNGGICRSVVCQKASSIIQAYSDEKKEDERIDLTYCCFIINSICNLSCRDCVQYIPNYPPHARGNVPSDIICRDIDIFFDMVDSVGTVSVMGGETFLHPDISKIARKFSEKKNLGFVSFPTNGLTPIKPEQLDGITDPRFVIAFGNYLHVATPEQKEIYYKNIELVKQCGIAYTESLHLPTWIETCKLNKRDVDDAYMTSLKQNCTLPSRNLQVKNGKVHICDKGVAVYNMGLADYPTDYFDLLDTKPRKEMREGFREFDNRPFYYTCGHCEPVNSSVESAIQGKKEIL